MLSSDDGRSDVGGVPKRLEAMVVRCSVVGGHLSMPRGASHRWRENVVTSAKMNESESHGMDGVHRRWVARKEVVKRDHGGTSDVGYECRYQWGALECAVKRSVDGDGGHTLHDRCGVVWRAAGPARRGREIDRRSCLI